MNRGGFASRPSSNTVRSSRDVPYNRRSRPSPLLNRPQPHGQDYRPRQSLLDLPLNRSSFGDSIGYDKYDYDRDHYSDTSRGFGRSIAEDLFDRRPLARPLLGEKPYDSYHDAPSRISQGPVRDFNFQRDDASALFSASTRRVLFEAVNDILAPIMDKTRMSSSSSGRQQLRPLMSEPLDPPPARASRLKGYGAARFDRGGRSSFSNTPRPLLSNDMLERTFRNRKSGAQRKAAARAENADGAKLNALRNKTKRKKKKSKQTKDYNYKEKMLNKPWVNEQLKEEISKKFKKLEEAKQANTEEIWQEYQEQKKKCYNLNAALRLEWIGNHPEVDLESLNKADKKNEAGATNNAAGDNVADASQSQEEVVESNADANAVANAVANVVANDVTNDDNVATSEGKPVETAEESNEVSAKTDNETENTPSVE